jgi:hypothetical protein
MCTLFLQTIIFKDNNNVYYMPYILEVQKYYVTGHHDFPQYNGKSEHVGYMNKIFKTKKEASDYYDKFNPHMRKLNVLETWCSDWDPNTCLLYIVRERFYEYLKIPPFEKQ